ncbi:MAG: RTX toxin, partial [Deltaproteobacteria bacterium]
MQVGAGNTHTCVLRSGGHVVCWGPAGFAGLDSYGNVGPSVVHISDTVIASNIVEIAVGETHWCGRESTGRVWCWGGNRSGESHPGEGL